MTPTETTARAQTECIAFDFDLHHSPQKVWRALTEPALLAEWLLPVLELELQPGKAFELMAPPQPGWDGVVHCRMLEIDAHRKLSYTWTVDDIDTVVTFVIGDRLELEIGRNAHERRCASIPGFSLWKT